MRPAIHAIGTLLAAIALSTGCATVDPAATVTATAEMLAARGIDGTDWRRTDESHAETVAASRDLLRQPLTSDVATQIVLLRSLDLQAELAALGIAQADLAQAARLSNPGFTFERLSGGGEVVRASGLAADVVDWLTQPLRRRMAEAEVERVKLEVAAAVFDHVGEAQQALIELRAALAETRLRRQVEEAERAAADYAIALHEAGNLTRRERSLVEASWLERKAELAESEARRSRAEEALRRALGLGPEDEWQVEPLSEAPTTATAAPSHRLEDAAVSQRLDLAAARWSLATLERARSLHRKTRWLPVGVELGVEREREADGVRLTGPTVELALPIFDTGRASLARYDAEILRARSQLAGLEMRVRSEVREAHAAREATLDMLELYSGSLIPLRRQALGLTVQESHQMIVGVFEVLEAKQDLLDAEMHHIEVLEKAWSAHVALQRALGSLLEIRSEEATSGDATAGGATATATPIEKEMNR